MLATIILDTFAQHEASEIAASLDDLCSPDDNYGFASAGVYAFWSVPERQILYIGLASKLGDRFRQHTGLAACDAKCCKRLQIADYFKNTKRLGYSIFVQSPMEQPPTKETVAELSDLYGEGIEDILQ